MNQNHVRSTAPFWEFYEEDFLAEHQRPANVALHLLGTIASAALVPWALSWWLPLLVLYPVVHAAPGLVGHYLFERNAAVGDLRVLRTDFPRYWFIAANHVLTAQLAMRAVRWLAGSRARAPRH